MASNTNRNFLRRAIALATGQSVGSPDDDKDERIGFLIYSVAHIHAELKEKAPGSYVYFFGVCGSEDIIPITRDIDTRRLHLNTKSPHGSTRAADSSLAHVRAAAQTLVSKFRAGFDWFGSGIGNPGSETCVIVWEKDALTHLADLLGVAPRKVPRTVAQLLKRAKVTENRLDYLEVSDITTVKSYLVATHYRLPGAGCEFCGKAGEGEVKLLRCKACRAVMYCGKECQRAHWRAGHKEGCGEIIAAEKAGIFNATASTTASGAGGSGWFMPNIVYNIDG